MIFLQIKIKKFIIIVAYVDMDLESGIYWRDRGHIWRNNYYYGVQILYVYVCVCVCDNSLIWWYGFRKWDILTW